MKTIILSINLILALLASPPIPKRAEGYEVANSQSLLQFNVFLDPHCPDSYNFYVILLSVLNSKIEDKLVKDLVSFKIHIYPLPYHRNSYLAAIALRFILKNYPEKFNSFLEKQFTSLKKYNVDVKNLDEFSVRELIIQDLEEVVEKPDARIRKVYENSEYDQNARIAWKFGTTRGVYGTPNLFINSVLYNEDVSTTEDLYKLIKSFSIVTEEI
jgi:hypothetical protein